MSPGELASRIAALDWSGASLQHQLAVCAAVETLKQLEPLVQIASNVVPIRTLTRWTVICNLVGVPWMKSCHFGPEGAWGWIVESVAHELECDEEQIGCLESDAEGPYNGDDLVTVDGLPVYRIQIFR